MHLKKKIFYLGFTLNQNNMNKLLNLYLLIAVVSINAQVTYIQGGGTLDDWAHLKKYEKDNMEIKGIDDPNRVVFMGNSITEGWLYFNKSFFIFKSFQDVLGYL
jgi:uncharacterized secreted protein with C-terminal beta-propeller domain